MKKLLTALLIATMTVSLVACGSSSDEPKEETKTEEKAKKEEPAKTEEASATQSELEALTGTPLVDAMAKISELGYTAKYYADGVDFTEFIDSVKDDYTTGEVKVDEDNKTVDVTLALTSNIEHGEMRDALEEKLNVTKAWEAAKDYGINEYGSDFELNYLVGKISEDAEDENTWFLKAECKAGGEDKICEAYVTGTSGAPEVTSFTVY